MLYANWVNECAASSLSQARFETQDEYDKILEMIGQFSTKHLSTIHSENNYYNNKMFQELQVYHVSLI